MSYSHYTPPPYTPPVVPSPVVPPVVPPTPPTSPVVPPSAPSTPLMIPGNGAPACSGPGSYGWHEDIPGGGCGLTIPTQVPTSVPLTAIPYTGENIGDTVISIMFVVSAAFCVFLIAVGIKEAFLRRSIPLYD